MAPATSPVTTPLPQDSPKSRGSRLLAKDRVLNEGRGGDLPVLRLGQCASLTPNRAGWVMVSIQHTSVSKAACCALPRPPQEERASETSQLLLGKFSCFTECLTPQRGPAAGLTHLRSRPPTIALPCSLPPCSLPPRLDCLAKSFPGKQADPGANVIPLLGLWANLLTSFEPQFANLELEKRVAPCRAVRF